MFLKQVISGVISYGTPRRVSFGDSVYGCLLS